MLRVEGIKKRYRDRDILKGVSLEVNRSEVVGVLGPNGAGKTTLFSVIMGFSPPTEGKISLSGEDITFLPPHVRARRGISFLPQEHTLFDELSVLENLLMFTEFFSLSREEAVSKAEQLLEDFGLLRYAGQRASTLSGGQKRRLEIARSLITNPKVILLDEPFAGLDPIIVAEIQELLRELRYQELGILITDHNVRETIRIVDRVYIISEGRIIASGYPQEVVQMDIVRKTYLGESFKL
jgi:lipopolysaccharide export system ATP-binding protein